MNQTESLFPSGFQWHHAVHEKWCGEQLWFCFLAFEPVYNKVRARDILIRCLGELGIRSYALYEITGQYDMLLRVWVPQAIAKFEEAMEDLLPEGGTATSVRVGEVVHHWVWQEHERSPIGAMRDPESDDLAQRQPLRVLETLNAIQAGTAVLPKPTDPPAVDTENGTNQLLADFKTKRLITTPPYEDGIKFLVQVKVTQEDLPRAKRKALQEQLCEILTETHGVIWDRSVYFCRHHIHFIIMGRVRFDTDSPTDALSTFHSITPLLLDKISQVAAVGGTKTYTYFFPRPGLVAFRDELTLEAPTTIKKKPSFTALFNREEDHVFEVKGSILSELDRWLNGKGDIVTSTDIANDALSALLRAITSFLNADGGTILLGALEPREYGKYDRCKEMPTVGKYFCCGLDWDLQSRRWDELARELMTQIETRIEPDPSRWITLWDGDVKGKPVAALVVQQPDEWYWLKGQQKDPQFIVRNNAKTKVLSGQKFVDYTRSRPEQRSGSM